jgi:hypothetical protein
MTQLFDPMTMMVLTDISTQVQEPATQEPFEYFEYQDGFYAGLETATAPDLQEQLAQQQTGAPACWYQGFEAGFRARPLRGDDPYTTVVPQLGRTGGVQKVHIPGILLRDGDPEFAEGYVWGGDCYYDEVETLVWPDGTVMTGTVTEEQLTIARSQKVRDITIDDVLNLFAEMKDYPEKEEERASVPCRVGMIVGYIAACIETYYDLTCKKCGANPATCTCTHP